MNAALLLHWLLRTSLEAGVLILLVLGLRFLLGARLSPRWRVGLWMLVGLKLLLPACIPASFGLGGWAKHATPPLAEPVAVAPSVPVMRMASADMLGEMGVAFNEGLPELSFDQGLVAFWITGVLAVFGVAVIRQLGFEEELRMLARARDRRLLGLLQSLSRKAGIRQSVDVILTPAGSTPAMVGIWRPHLLLPQDWRTRFDDASLSHVLLHELQHIRHHDLFWNWIALVVQALHWFNPLVWIAMSRFQTDRELRCDLGALDLLPSDERLGYGHTLLRVQETFFAPPAVAGLAPCVRNHPALRQRITMIAQPSQHRPWLQTIFTLTFSLIACYAFTTSAADEKEVPAEKRGSDEQKNPEAADGSQAPRERDGDRPKTGPRDGDRPKAPGIGDREGVKTGPPDGKGPKTGPRDGEKKNTGPRDGENKKAGIRDGDQPKTGERDTGRPSKEAAMKAAPAGGETIAIQVTDRGRNVVIGKDEMPLNRLRGYLQGFLPEHPDAQVVISGKAHVPEKALFEAMDAVRDNGNKNVRIAEE